MKNTKLRFIWIIPNVILYLVFITISIFVGINAEGLEQINRLSIWVIFNLLLLAVAVLGSVQIWNWIKEGKM